MYNNRFCYKIDKKAKIGWDEELKDYCGAYVQATIKTQKELPKELREDMVSKIKKRLASQAKINENYLTPVSEEEFDTNTED